MKTRQHILGRLYRKYKNMNLQVKIVFWFTLVGFFSKGISLISTPIFTRVLSTSEYGKFSVFSSYFTIVSVIATMNLHLTAVYNALTRHESSKEKVISSFQSVSLCTSLVICTIAFIFKEHISDLMNLSQTVVSTMFIGFIFVEPYQLWLVYKRYQFEYKKPIIFTAVISVLTPIISLVAIYLAYSNKGEARILAYLAVNTFLPGFICYFANYKKSKTFYDANLWRYAVLFAVPLIPHYLSETLLNQTDKIMINAYFGSSEAGIYNIAFTAASFIQILTSAINSAYIPWQFQKIKAKEYKILGNVSYSILLFLAVLISLVTLFAPEIVYILAGENYIGAVGLIPTLGASVFFNYMYQLYARIEMYCEKKSYTIIATFSATVLNIVLNMVFMPSYGYNFAGVSTLISHIVFCIVHFYFYRRVCRECLEGAKVYDSKIMLGISSLLLLFTAVVTWSYNYFVMRVVILCLILILIITLKKKIICIINGIIEL